MATIRFEKIGEAFPASDPVARFVTVLAMVSNDANRSMDELLDVEDGPPDSGARRMMLFRQQASFFFEAATFIGEASSRFNEVRDFIAGLPQEARDECAQVVGGIDPSSTHYVGDWLRDHRNVTFHYSEMHPEKAAHGKEEITQALEDAAELPGTVNVSDELGGVRFWFARLQLGAAPVYLYGAQLLYQALGDGAEQSPALRLSVLPALGRELRVLAERYAGALTGLAGASAERSDRLGEKRGTVVGCPAATNSISEPPRRTTCGRSTSNSTKPPPACVVRVAVSVYGPSTDRRCRLSSCSVNIRNGGLGPSDSRFDLLPLGPGCPCPSDTLVFPRRVCGGPRADELGPQRRRYES
jgi:hypothetical protein